jgi:hypothetical protein
MTYDRWFLLGEKRNELLARWEVEQYLAELTARFPWSATMIYDINSPGQNAGLLVATHGWTPA